MHRFKKENFDLALGEAFDSCYYAVLEMIGIKNYITVFSMALFETPAKCLGLPAVPSFLPSKLGSIH